MTKKHFIKAVHLIRDYPIMHHEALISFMCELGRYANSSFSSGTFKTYYETLERKDEILAEYRDLPKDLKLLLESSDRKTRRLGLIVFKDEYPGLYQDAKDYNVPL